MEKALLDIDELIVKRLQVNASIIHALLVLWDKTGVDVSSTNKLIMAGAAAGFIREILELAQKEDGK